MFLLKLALQYSLNMISTMIKSVENTRQKEIKFIEGEKKSLDDITDIILQFFA